jgi:hypothetical protein
MGDAHATKGHSQAAAGDAYALCGTSSVASVLPAPASTSLAPTDLVDAARRLTATTTPAATSSATTAPATATPIVREAELVALCRPVSTAAFAASPVGCGPRPSASAVVAGGVVGGIVVGVAAGAAAVVDGAFEAAGPVVGSVADGAVPTAVVSATVELAVPPVEAEADEAPGGDAVVTAAVVVPLVELIPLGSVVVMMPRVGVLLSVSAGAVLLTAVVVLPDVM